MTADQNQAKWNVAEWQGKMLVDINGEKIGKLQDVYVDIETDEPQFATVKEGFIGRHLTFVPLGGIQIGPDDLQVAVTRIGRVCARHRPPWRRAHSGGRVDPLSPLRAELHADRHRERTPSRSSLRLTGAVGSSNGADEDTGRSLPTCCSEPLLS